MTAMTALCAEMREYLLCWCRMRQNAAMVREWLWRHGRLMVGVTTGVLFFGSVMVAHGHHYHRSLAVVVVGGVVVGACVGAVMAVILPWMLGVGRLFELPMADAIAVRRAVSFGKAVPDPRLAPSVIAHATRVVESLPKQKKVLTWLAYAMAVLELADAVTKAVRGSAWGTVVFYIAASAMFAASSRATPRELDRRRANARAAADLASGQLGGLGIRSWMRAFRRRIAW